MSDSDAQGQSAPPLMNRASPRPLFVLGLQRSGTTWLGNLLAAHSDVVAVQSADHFGVHESIYFSHFAAAFADLENDATLAEFCRAFEASDYFLLTELPEGWSGDLDTRQHAEIFRQLMEAFAIRQGDARFWLEKSPDHALLAYDLAGQFPDAAFVAIARNPAHQIRSRLWAMDKHELPLLRRWRLVARLAIAANFHSRWLARFSRQTESAIMVRYEELKNDPDTHCRRVLSFLGLPYQPDLWRSEYERNTSLPDESERRKPPRPADRALLAILKPLLYLIPLRILASLARRQRRRNWGWPEWTWRRSGYSPPAPFRSLRP